MNNVTLVGNLCRDPELRQTQSGQNVASTTIAVRRDRKEPDGTVKSDFFDLVIWGNQADYAAKYIRKGDKVAVAGSVQIRDYTTKQGIKGRAVEVIVTSISSLEPKQDSEEQVQAPVQDAQPAGEEAELDDDDLPF